MSVRPNVPAQRSSRTEETKGENPYKGPPAPHHTYFVSSLVNISSLLKKMNVLAVLSAILLLACLSTAKVISMDRPFDQDTAASDHHYGRVHIKVFRGPGHEHHFAPHGYWIKQPADDGHHHHK
ncbi:hypothetical protein GE061_002299 [Apolygus lucorum]|uniref:Uncharacterized protein n=1 Tax=Apolygus lucorum TaxID=248454 RepID=A0A8S9X6J6_APOLU|nr:hypothetical protein GE061_002299 [Apolygus lucorum]